MTSLATPDVSPIVDKCGGGTCFRGQRSSSGDVLPQLPHPWGERFVAEQLDPRAQQVCVGQSRRVC